MLHAEGEAGPQRVNLLAWWADQKRARGGSTMRPMRDHAVQQPPQQLQQPGSAARPPITRSE